MLSEVIDELASSRGSDSAEKPSLLLLRHTYRTDKVDISFVGPPAIFGGPSDELVIGMSTRKHIQVVD